MLLCATVKSTISVVMENRKGGFSQSPAPITIIGCLEKQIRHREQTHYLPRKSIDRLAESQSLTSLVTPC